MKKITPALRTRLLVLALALALLALCLAAALAVATPAARVAGNAAVTAENVPDSSAPEACTNVIVGKNATVDGSAITSYSSDGPSGANAKINVFVFVNRKVDHRDSRKVDHPFSLSCGEVS